MDPNAPAPPPPNDGFPAPPPPPPPPAPNQQPQAKRSRYDEPTIPTFLLPMISGPRVAVEQFERPVTQTELNGFFNLAYDEYVSLVYPDHAVPPAHIVTQAQWTNFLMAAFKSRVDHAYSRSTGVRPPNRIPLISGVPIPKYIADVINSYGKLVVLENSSIIVPAPSPPAAGVNPPTTVMAEQAAFSTFVASIAHRGFCKLSVLSNSEMGSAAYTLVALSASMGRTAVANPIVANIFTLADRSAHIYSFHSSFSPSDVLLAASMANGFNNNLFHSRDWPFYAAAVNDVPGIRTSLFSMY